MGFALRCDLADQHVTHIDFCADVHDAALVQTRQLRFGQIRDVARDFFRTQLGIACHHGQLFDMDRGEAVFRHHTFGDQDRVFEVVAVPRHERDHHVLTQRQFAHVGRCTIGHHVAARDHIAHVHQRTLVDVGVLVGTGVLGQVVDIHADFAGCGFVIMDAHHDTAGIHVVHTTAAPRLHGRAGVNRNGALDTGSDQCLFGTQQGTA